ncbi:Hexose carrier protein HEX6 [Glycine soja]|uniref:Hexose carrier protein HEX6 n=1 Tax=Glycine soja TaxID=3848 RepID=A0A0B2RLC8_GLYSO|nr:Hexose carrier protein HEX6 [Glycine soja]
MMAAMGGVIFGYDIGITAFGCKPSIVARDAAFLAGTTLGGAAFNVDMLIFGRLLLGVGVGFANQAVPLYLSEMALPQLRGAINNGFQLSIGIDALSANLINYGTEKIEGGWGWRMPLAMAAVPALVLTLVTGINVIAFYAPLLFRTIGLGENASLLYAVLTGVCIVRGIMALHLKDHGGLSKEYAFVILVIICIYVVGVMGATRLVSTK